MIYTVISTSCAWPQKNMWFCRWKGPTGRTVLSATRNLNSSRWNQVNPTKSPNLYEQYFSGLWKKDHRHRPLNSRDNLIRWLGCLRSISDILAWRSLMFVSENCCLVPTSAAHLVTRPGAQTEQDAWILQFRSRASVAANCCCGCSIICKKDKTFTKYEIWGFKHICTTHLLRVGHPPCSPWPPSPSSSSFTRKDLHPRASLPRTSTW